MSKVDLTRLEQAMEDADMDQSALARAVGCTPGAINQIVLGNTRKSRLLPDIARALGVTFDWLTGVDADAPRPGRAPAQLRRDEFQLLENFRPLPARDRAAVDKITAALRLADNLERGIYPLPTERALEQMFLGLLDTLPEEMPRDEVARELAQLLPIGLSQLKGLLIEPPTPSTTPAAAAEALATADRESRR
jgi:transcriptional regulator with XRE-family HTH domain